jgi:hypothetical protein
MLAVSVIWVLVTALLQTMGLGRGATTAVGFLLVFIFGPLPFTLTSGRDGSSNAPAGNTDSPSTIAKEAQHAGGVGAANAIHGLSRKNRSSGNETHR